MYKNKINQESGRSMVEMLGVLAIIGVLSVGGISGYTTAMNKHKANEILNAATVRAMAVATQIQNGSTSPTLGEFTDHEVGGATFDDGTITSSGGKFTIGFTNDGKPSEAVLKQMEQIAGTDGIVRAITEGGLTYNDDLSTGDGDNAETDPACEPACEEGETCQYGYCIAKNTSDGSCAKNSDCNDWCAGQEADKCYCAISAEPKMDNDGNYISDTSCYQNFTGQCAVATTNDDVTAGGYVASSDYMTWWSAQNFCKAFPGKSMVSLSELGITGGYQSSASCSGAGCTGANWTTLKSQLDPNGDYYYYWTKDAVSCDLSSRECQSGSNDGSCRAFAVNPLDEYVYDGDGRDDYFSYYALCK